LSHKASNEQPNLDILRAAAVLCVAFAHLYNRVTGTNGDTAWHFGQLGVLIFFVHTAYVLMWSLERSAPSLTGRDLWVDFYIRRLFRIYPLAMVAVGFGWFGWGPSQHVWTTRDLLVNLTLTMNVLRGQIMWGVLWTLPIEVQMYIVLPALFVFLRDRGWRAVLGVMSVAVIAGMIQPSDRLNVMEYAPCFVAGVLAWSVARVHRATVGARWWPLVFVMTWPIWLVATRDNQEYYRWAFCITLGGAIPLFRDVSYRPVTRIAASIAKYSYGIYLSHSAIFLFAMRFTSPFVRWPLMIALAVGIPVALYHAIEDPMIRLGRSVAARRGRPVHVRISQTAA
jgi:peptidoglycan/LPS O-acetylase OafA/YrhL